MTPTFNIYWRTVSARIAAAQPPKCVISPSGPSARPGGTSPKQLPAMSNASAPRSLGMTIAELIRRCPMTAQDITSHVEPPYSDVRAALQTLHIDGVVKHHDGLWMGAAHYNKTYRDEP